MKARTARLLAPVLRDVAACAGLDVRIEDDYRPVPGYGPPAGEESIMIWMPDGSGTGLWTSPGLTEDQQLAEVSDRVHEAVVEGRWSEGLSTAWPPCPWHPDSHPLGVELRRTQVVWACPSNQRVAWQVGQLAC